jgi:hypothetical protein
MIALAPKNYYITDRKEATVKQKGVTIDKNRNSHLNTEAFEGFAEPDAKPIAAENYVLRRKGQMMTNRY